MSLDPALLVKLVCPISRGRLRYDEAAQELVSEAAGLAYPIRSGVPVMLVEEARRLDRQAAQQQRQLARFAARFGHQPVLQRPDPLHRAHAEAADRRGGPARDAVEPGQRCRSPSPP